MDIREAYTRAESFLSWNVSSLYFGAQVKPNWIGSGERFWYRVDRRGEIEFVLVDVASRSKRPAFDHTRLAAALSAASGTSVEAGKLPIESIEFVEDGRAIRFGALGGCWQFDLNRGTLSPAQRASPARPGELLSPDGRWAAFVQDHNVCIRDPNRDETFALTSDGEPHCGYACRTEAEEAMVPGRPGVPEAPVALWSPDSKRLLTHRLDERKVGELHLLQSVPPDGSRRPVLHSYRWAMAGEEHIGEEQIVVLDVETRSCVAVQHGALPMHIISSSVADGRACWGRDCRRAFLVALERGYKVARLCEIDAATGRVREVMRETCRTYFDTNLAQWTRPNVRVLGDHRTVIWFSERDGYGHLYLHDGATGALRNRITGGPWVVRDILRVDEARRLLYFTGGGKEAGRDPYLRHLYRVGLDGGEPILLTPEDADHEVSFSPDGFCFVDFHSRIDSAPVSVLRSSNGKLLLTLEEADLRDLVATGWKYPERFTAKARDGVTDIHGLICRPTSYDPGKRYPVIDVTYPGPIDTRTPVTFPTDRCAGSYFWDLQAMAEVGFIVVTVDGLGTPYRSKAIHDFCYGTIEDCGHEDHIAALRQLARRDPAMDLDRVGITGHSLGGYAAMRAMLAYPDFYKAGVASAGNHENRAYLPYMLEKWQGNPPDESWERQDNCRLAANLRGHLLLVCCDMDANVHPSQNTLMVDALVRADKDFDLVVLSNRTHQYYRDVYYLRRTWDHFTRHLLGVEPPRGYRIRPAPEDVLT